MISIIKKYLAPFFNTRAAGIYILLFATVIAIATFIENDFGTSSAQKVVFRAWWFELLLLLFSITLVVNIIKFRMIPQKKWALLLFHTSMIIILIGAGVTRYFGFEGTMHIREHDSSNTLLSAETYLNFEVIKDGQKFQFSEPVLFATLGNNHLKKSYLIGEDLIEIEIKDFVPNPKQVLKDSPNGVPTLKIVIGGKAGREEYFISPGQAKRIRDVVYNFKEGRMPNAINLAYKNNTLLINSDKVLEQTIMATQTKDTLLPGDQYYPLKLRSLYSDGSNRCVFGDFKEQGEIFIESESQKVKSESMTALLADISVNGVSQSTYIFGRKGSLGSPINLDSDQLKIAVSYGSKEITTPFSLKLYDFIMDKYPGTSSAASYASEVQLIDPINNKMEDYRIYMNHILDYQGYRFFQSSFDPDEKGTYLSVNHDSWGTWISYLGYFILTLGLVMIFFSKNTRFSQLAQKIKKIRATSGTFILLFLTLMSANLSAQETIPQAPKNIINAEHAEKFSRLIVQDHKGRMKPMQTLSKEILRKLARKESLYGLSADQIILGMLANSHDWDQIPLIKLGKHEKIKKKLGISGNLATYNDFFSPGLGYKLREETREAYSLNPVDRGVYEKELMKIDEKVNIASMVFSGRIFKIIPLSNDENNTWVSSQPSHGGDEPEDPVAQKFFAAYPAALREAMKTNDYTLVNQLIDELANYQKTVGQAVMPSPSKIKAEILLNKLNVFNRLALVYFFLGLAFLFFLFLSVFKEKLKLATVYKILFALVLVGFAFHTLGLGLRWYVSGRAPWSNGYESMIYIAWTSTLAGILFTRKSFGGLAATMILAATILLVAFLSYMDPEITPLVPVLKSYWLTIHVSLEAGSYGFLMLGAIIGLINLILMIFLTEKNKTRVLRIVKEMSYISEMTLIGGLVMVSIGTYLGGVWANESWGRYWGWDAKETWALVTVLVYAFILHMRIIPKLGSLYLYNVMSLFGWASVIMTYYGVNYYLSGLHSYAAGDPVPVPNWVYIVVVSLVIISLLAYWRKSRFKMFG